MQYVKITNHRFVSNKAGVCMRATARKKVSFQDFHQMKLFARVVAIRTNTGKWRLFGLCRNTDTAVYVEAARGGVREWSGLNYLADFCSSIGVELWEVHNKKPA